MSGCASFAHRFAPPRVLAHVVTMTTARAKRERDGERGKTDRERKRGTKSKWPKPVVWRRDMCWYWLKNEGLGLRPPGRDQPTTEGSDYLSSFFAGHCQQERRNNGRPRRRCHRATTFAPNFRNFQRHLISSTNILEWEPQSGEAPSPNPQGNFFFGSKLVNGCLFYFIFWMFLFFQSFVLFIQRFLWSKQAS